MNNSRVCPLKSQLLSILLVLAVSACAGRGSAGNGAGITDSLVSDSAAKSTTIAVPRPAPDSFPVGKIIDPVICTSDHGQSYALYIPAKKSQGPLPVIYFFDPHAAGVLPLLKYQSLADSYGFILVGSNNSKNGNDWPTAESIWQQLSVDTKDRLKIDMDRIYTCGFSGGAKVASYLALHHPEVKGVIVNGAGLPDEAQAGNFNFSVTAIAGEGDMNLTELVGVDKQLDNTRTRHRILFFDGKHEWAPTSSMGLAFTGLELDAMQTGLLPKDPAFIAGYTEKSKKRLDAWFAANQLIKVAQECAISISLLEGLSDAAGWFKEKLDALAGNAQYQKQRQAQERLLTTEQNTKAEYMQHFQQDDMPYWSATIRDLQIKTNIKSAERGMYQRLLAYLSLAFYSISNQLMNSNENTEARHFVELYKMADPTNSEAWYFSAMLDAREGHGQAAESDLQKAVENGFRDKNRMMQQAEFLNLSPPMNFSAVDARMQIP